MNADFSALVRFSADIGKAKREVDRFAAVELRKAAVAIRDDAKANAPSNTGRLKRSISLKVNGPLDFEIGPTAWYGHFVEGGTSRQPPRPYMDPAADRQEPIIERRLGDIGVRLLDA